MQMLATQRSEKNRTKPLSWGSSLEKRVNCTFIITETIYATRAPVESATRTSNLTVNCKQPFPLILMWKSSKWILTKLLLINKESETKTPVIRAHLPTTSCAAGHTTLRSDPRLNYHLRIHQWITTMTGKSWLMDQKSTRACSDSITSSRVRSHWPLRPETRWLAPSRRS